MKKLIISMLAITVLFTAVGYASVEAPAAKTMINIHTG